MSLWARTYGKCWEHGNQWHPVLILEELSVESATRRQKRNSVQRTLTRVHLRVITIHSTGHGADDGAAGSDSHCHHLHSIEWVLRLCSKSLSYINSLNFHNNPVKKVYYYHTILTDGETEAQRFFFLILKPKIHTGTACKGLDPDLSPKSMALELTYDLLVTLKE